jgi:DnaK suppressor protein
VGTEPSPAAPGSYVPGDTLAVIVVGAALVANIGVGCRRCQGQDGSRPGTEMKPAAFSGLLRGASRRRTRHSTVSEVLGAERQAALSRIREMTLEWEAIVESSENANIDDEHDPEGSTVAYERARIAALLAAAHGYRDDLDQALARLADGTFGVCERCGGVIGEERVAARPAARTCFSCASFTPSS